VSTEPVPPTPRPIVRRRSDAVLLLVGLVVFALSAIPIERDHVPSLEVSTFEAVNDAPSLPFAPVWVLMQMGNAVVVLVAAVAALVWRKPRLAAGLAAGGVLVYLGAKVIKDIIVRERPLGLLADVVVRGDPARGLGYVSGHAAVITVLAVVAAPYLGRRGRWIVYAVAVAVCLTRMYVGAHLPLDVIGGAAFGVAIGAAIRLALGRPDPEAPEAPAPATPAGAAE
jgi:undecaprenyl-diphosphatase